MQWYTYAMVSDKFGYIWSPLFLTLFVIEYNSPMGFCGSLNISGQMWFMWLMMGLAASGKWLNLLEEKVRGKQ